ncbi:amino acid ABC transporter substrate-binding protein [Candidatus Magnetomorum sp. HK-1]|nr:amino acid ABC transporter substrate-binding protein [Candidatus Magnetomorum sp. HK-1]
MKNLLLWAVFFTFCFSAHANDFMLEADYRQRPPEMIINETTGAFSGPLIDILNLAAADVGLTVNWHNNYFKRSYSRLIRGNVDIVPRVIKKDERKAFIKFFDPIGYQQKNIVFIVRKGKSSLIQKYEDLYKISVGVKKGTAYFDKFDNDAKISKKMSVDDKNMSMMFAAKRFDAMIILDISAFEKALKKIGFNDYTYADYKHVQVISNQYGMSKNSSKIKLFDSLNRAFNSLVKQGKIRQCYQKYNLLPLLTESEIAGMDKNVNNSILSD